MVWYKDPGGHVIESNNKKHRLLFCQRCQSGGKLIMKSSCELLRCNSKGHLYKVKRYYYSKTIAPVITINKDISEGVSE
jgi:hypothetical protein